MTKAEKYATIATNNEVIAENIPKVYAAGQSSMVDESKLIPKTVSGSYISVDDVSEIPHGVGCKVESVNLLPPPTGNITHNGITYTINSDGTITMNGTATAASWHNFPQLKWDAEENVDMVAYMSDAIVNDAYNNVQLCVIQYNESGNTIAATYLWTSKRVTISPECKRIRVDLYVKSGVTLNNVTIYPMLNKGTTALPYTPYVKPEEVEVTRTGVNLVSQKEMAEGWYYPSIDVTATYSEEEDCLIINGTAAVTGSIALINIDIPTTIGETITLSKKYISGEALVGDSGSIGVIYVSKSNAQGEAGANWFNVSLRATDSTATQVIDSRYISRIWLYLNKGSTYKDYKIKIQINRGNTLPYEPYNGQTLTPATDGTVEGMTSVSPYMNVFADTEGVNIEATYNKSYGMQTEYDRFWDAFQGQLPTEGVSRFSGAGWNENNFKPKHDIKPQLGTYMFWYSRINASLSDILKECGVTLDTSALTTCQYMFYLTQFTELPDINLFKCTNMQLTFANSAKLRKIGTIILPSSPVSYSTPFDGCAALSDVSFEGNFIYSISFQRSPLTIASAQSVINALMDYSGTDKDGMYSVTFSSTTMTRLNEAGAIFNGMTWDAYVTSIGWTV